jgi:hypothetical protein
MASALMFIQTPSKEHYVLQSVKTFKFVKHIPMFIQSAGTSCLCENIQT